MSQYYAAAGINQRAEVELRELEKEVRRDSVLLTNSTLAH